MVNVWSGTPAAVAVSVYVPASAPSVYVTDATPPLSVVLVVSLIEPPAAAQLTGWSAIPFPNASASLTLSVNFEPATAAGLSDPNLRSSAGGPATSTILNVVRIDPTFAMTLAVMGAVPGV